MGIDDDALLDDVIEAATSLPERRQLSTAT